MNGMLLPRSHTYQGVTHFERLISNEDLCTHKVKYWEGLFTITQEEFVNAFTELYDVTDIIKYRSFQYTILHGTVMLNDRSAHMNIVIDNKCTFCKNHKEDC